MHYHIRGPKILFGEEPYFYIKHPLGPFKITQDGKLIKVKRIPPNANLKHSSHIDFRIEWGDYLIGWTLVTGNTGDDMLKIMHATDRRKMLAISKAVEPYAWLEITTPKKPLFISPRGHVGATRKTEGVFVHLDSGLLWPGTLKPTFAEYFLEGSLLQGRYVLRSVVLDIIDPDTQRKAGKDHVFLFWKPKDQKPYILSKRAKRKGYLPPKGEVPIAPQHIKEYTSDLYDTLLYLLEGWGNV